MMVEVRSYRIKPGQREEFVKMFETRAVPAQRAIGMEIMGPLLDLENPNSLSSCAVLLHLNSVTASKTRND